jgi:hypothetical protein
MWDGDLGELAKDLIQPTAPLREFPIQCGEPTSALTGGLIDSFEPVELLERGQQPRDRFAES